MECWIAALRVPATTWVRAAISLTEANCSDKQEAGRVAVAASGIRSIPLDALEANRLRAPSELPID
jgi:hypothetical protein